MPEKTARQVEMEQEYVRIGLALKRCATLDHLREVWTGNQADIGVLPPTWQAELTAEKDRLKTKLQGAKS
jgi:hypothetical protein